jgi:membrane protein DedA with SNARE-associated domain
MRIVLSAFAGAFEVPYRVFIVSVLISSTIWAAIFLEVGRHLGRQSRILFRLMPAHLLPLFVLIIVMIGIVAIAYERGWRPHRRKREALPRASQPAAPDPSKPAATRS